MLSKFLLRLPFHRVLQVLFALCIATGAAGSTDPPDTLILDTLRELYEPVVFNHGMHMDVFDCSACHHHTVEGTAEQPICSRCHRNGEAAEHVTCSACHHSAQDSHSIPGSPPGSTYHIDKPGLKGALHLQCLGCHKTEGGPKACRECHGFSTAGKERFLITESK